MAANSTRRSGDRLAQYREKRTPGRTPEPFGSVRKGAGPLSFVVQKHAARRTHYDFRLELDGVLVSWAVPKGPSLDPKEKRFAVQTENHPLDYADFEGVIPEGNYGAGAVIVWDRGTWEPIEGTAAEALEAGELKFRLAGYKLGGTWLLIRIDSPTRGRAHSHQMVDVGEGDAGDPKSQWLLIKKADSFADTAGSRPLSEQSVLSGMTVDELAAGAPRARQVREAVATLGAPRRLVLPYEVKLALCETRRDPFTAAGWLFELKYDGYRLIAAVRGRKPLLRYRRGSDATRLYPEIALALSSLPVESAVIDGEVVVFDAEGRADFGRLQQRAMLERAQDITIATRKLPAVLIAFDLLELEGHDLRRLPLTTRKQLLRQILPEVGPLRYSDHIEERGEALFEKVRELGLEGIIGKRADSPYPGARSQDWVKVRIQQVHDFAVVGYAKPRKQARVGFRALHLAVRDGERWVYAGRVGSGFDDRELREIRTMLDALPRADHRFPEAEADSDQVWVEARLVVEVRYQEWRDGRSVRGPSFLRLRDDKAAEECGRPKGSLVDSPPEPAVVVDEVPAAERTLSLTNLGKVFWPESGQTKGDLIEYYRQLAPWLMPYLRDRLLVLTRFPDGIAGKSFYQKDAPQWVPDWIRTTTVWSEHSQRDIHYFICDEVESLIYLVNLGTIPLHVWSSRASKLTHPDWSILDLDPKGAPFSDVVEVALAIRRLCDAIELPTYVKTSGSTGLHILIPLGGLCTYEDSRSLAGLIAQLIEAERRDIATVARAIDRRAGKVYIDWLQNRHGQLLVSPFSARPLPGAPVSMPLSWDEVTPSLDFGKFNLRTAIQRMERLGADPMVPVLTDVPDLLAALERLSGRLGQPR